MKTSWGKSIYIASRGSEGSDADGNPIYTYSAPVAYSINVQPVRGFSDLQLFGERASQMQVGIVDKAVYDGTFHPFDLAYLDGASPSGESVNGEYANYCVDSVLVGNRGLQVYFRRITNRA